MMSIRTFKAYISSHGADLSKWDDESARQARELLAASGEARGIFSKEEKLDLALDSFSAPVVRGDDVTALIHGARLRRMQATKKSAPAQKRASSWFPVLAGGGLAFATCAAVIVFTQAGVAPIQAGATGAGTEVAALSVVAPADDPAGMVDELEGMMAAAEADLRGVGEMVEMLEMAQAQPQPGTDQTAAPPAGPSDERDIDIFLDSLSSPQPGADSGQDVWEEFMGNG